MSGSRDEKTVHTIGIIGAGKLGRTLARLSIDAGYDVAVAGSGTVAQTATVLGAFAPGARSVTLSEAAGADLVVLAVAISDAENLDPEQFSGAVVVDPTNRWEEVDGARADLDDPLLPTSVALQRALSTARVVKAVNHVAYKDLAGGAREEGSEHRIGIAIAGDDDQAVSAVAQWVESLGFDPVIAGRLADTYGWQPGGEIFGLARSAEELRRALERSRRA